MMNKQKHSNVVSHTKDRLSSPMSSSQLPELHTVNLTPFHNASSQISSEYDDNFKDHLKNLKSSRAITDLCIQINKRDTISKMWVTKNKLESTYDLMWNDVHWENN
jgi:hypothetical protein